jgi:glycosyltransferase involved in cell wall biosynthesis
MKRINADIYFHQAGSPGIVSIFSRLNQKKMIKIIASDADVSSKIIINDNIFIQILSKLADWIDIFLAHTVICQNYFQKEILKRKFKINSFLIKNPICISSDVNKKNDNNILWVGTIRNIKQPEILLTIAQSFPDYKFIMIGGSGESIQYYEKIKNAATKMSNILFLGYIPNEKISQIFYYHKHFSCQCVS